MAAAVSATITESTSYNRDARGMGFPSDQRNELYDFRRFRPTRILCGGQNFR